MKNLESLINTYYDFHKKGIAFKDVLGIIQDTAIFKELIHKMASNKVIKNSDAIISIEARGFIFGSAISFHSSKPMIVARKPGKLPGELIYEIGNIPEEAYLILEGYVIIEKESVKWGKQVKEAADKTLLPSVKHSWYLGANIPGKPKVFMPYAGGLPSYRKICDEIKANDYSEFELL